jgi:hypothetical protein
MLVDGRHLCCHAQPIAGGGDNGLLCDRSADATFHPETIAD